eukprot:2109997-Pyramimonas_sp.AAC.1
MSRVFKKSRTMMSSSMARAQLTARTDSASTVWTVVATMALKAPFGPSGQTDGHHIVPPLPPVPPLLPFLRLRPFPFFFPSLWACATCAS